MILDTEWESADRRARVTDFMPPPDEVVDIVRIVEGLSGAVRMRGELTLRFDYGQVVPWVRQDKSGIWAVAGSDAAYLDTRLRRGTRTCTLSATSRCTRGERGCPSY